MKSGKWWAVINLIMMVAVAVVVMLHAMAALAQNTHIRSVSTLPIHCSGGSPARPTDQIALVTGGVGVSYTCSAPDTWTPTAGSGNISGSPSVGSIPAGNGSAFVSQPGPVVDVRNYVGVDWCAQVNAADTAFIGVAATILVPSAMSAMTPCTTSINLTSGHQLKFSQGIFDLGVQTGRAGIRIGPAVNNVSVVGAGIGQTILQYASANTGIGNGFPNGSAIGLGRVAGCTSDAAANNYVTISGISFHDQNTGSALASGHNPSGIDGACVNFLTIERNEFTDIKGNAAITVTGNFGGGGGNTYYDRDNVFDGTVAGGGGEFTADNSSNWTHYYVLHNTVSRWPCGFGVAIVNEGLIALNTLDMTLKAPFSGCQIIAIGAGSDSAGQLASVFAINNIITMGFSGVAMGIFPKSTTDYNTEFGIIGNDIHLASGSSITGLSINGVAAGHIPPTMIVRNNSVSVNFPTALVGVLGDVEFSDNVFNNSSANIPMFSCAGTASIRSGSTVRVYNNRISTSTAKIIGGCSDASFGGRSFREWNNTLGDGALTVLTVGTLPICDAGTEGRYNTISDATAPTYNATLTGGGSIHIPVYCNGTAWTAH